MGLHKDPMLDKAIAMAFNSGDFAAAWRACGKPGTWRNADRQWKAAMKKQQEQQQASAAQQQEQAAAAHQTPLHGKAPVSEYVTRAKAAGAQGFVRRESDFVKGVTDLVAPIMGADGIIATLITPYIQRTKPVCEADEALAHLRSAAQAISDEMAAVSQA